jgi:hypothetical protein
VDSLKINILKLELEGWALSLSVVFISMFLWLRFGHDLFEMIMMASIVSCLMFFGAWSEKRDEIKLVEP